MNRKRLTSALNTVETYSAANVATFRLGSVPTAIAEDMPLGLVQTAGKIAAQHTGGTVRQTKLTLAAVQVSVVGATGVGFGGTQIYDFPKGQIHVLGVTAALAFDFAGTSITATAVISFGLGTAVAANGNLNDATDIDLLPSTNSAAAVAGITAAKGASLVTSAQFDGRTTAKDMFLNLNVPDANIGETDIVKATGTIVITWVDLGDTVA
jgi:hypothetical protein